jgi:hypothetical protein
MTHDITSFGAVGNGKTLNTRAIQAAIDAAHQAGGGTVTLPPGRWLTGTIFIKSNVTFDLSAGATLLGSARWEDYPAIEYHAKKPKQPRHLVAIMDAHNVELCGRGVIDGQGWNFWQPESDAEGWIRAKTERPGPMLSVSYSRDVVVRGVRLTNPPHWHSQIYESDRVTVEGISIISDHRQPNNDGLDLLGSQDVIISNCFIDTGDDAICVYSAERDCQRVTITNCILRSDCVGLKIGWETQPGGSRQVSISNCIVFGSNRCVAFYTAGGVIEDITVSNIVFDSNVPVILPRPIHMDLRHNRATGKLGVIRNVSISNMVVRTQGRLLMTAQAGGNIENITLRDIQLIYPYIEDPRERGKDATSNQFSTFNPEARRACAAVVAENIKNLVMENLRVSWPGERVPDEWRLPIKRENGGYRVFHPDYATPRPVEFSLVWGRGLHGGHIDAPLAGPSAESAGRFDLEDCTIE